MSKILEGKIVGANTQKTLVVEVETKHPHPLYKKVVKKIKKYLVHFEDKAPKIGARVKIIETRPISKKKHFRLLEVINDR